MGERGTVCNLSYGTYLLLAAHFCYELQGCFLAEDKTCGSTCKFINWCLLSTFELFFKKKITHSRHNVLRSFIFTRECNETSIAGGQKALTRSLAHSIL